MNVSLSRRALLARSATAAAGALLGACGHRSAEGYAGDVGGSRLSSLPFAPERQAGKPATTGNFAATQQPVPADAIQIIASAKPADGPPVRTDEFSMTGVFDVDWLADPSFASLLDNFAASPGAFTAVRFFGALNSGTKEKTTPVGSSEFGVRCSMFEETIRHTELRTPNSELLPALDGLEALTSRGLTPFVQLSFFPASVSSSPVVPPASFDGWRALVRDFLDALVADPRFGLDAIRTWWFEVWNEPNIPVFWQGTFEQYLDLYRATAEAVRASGYTIRLGGPALAWLPATDGAAGAPLMRRFLEFLRDEPDVQCDFVSFHEKGTWVNPVQGDAAPALGDLVSAADETARMALAIVPERARNLPIINNEADMKVGFDIPYEPRMTERFPAWLASLLVAYDGLSVKYRDTGIRFHAASDNANLQLVQAPFDGRRAVMTRASPTATSDLFKLPVYHFYELLRLMGDARGTLVNGAEQCYPDTDLFHLLTVGEQQVGALFSVYPTDVATAQPRAVEYAITDLPWQRINIARFQIDATHSNAYPAAGGQLSPALPDAAMARTIRQAQELALFAPIQQGVALVDGTFRDRFTIMPFTTLLYWITPYSPAAPPAPRWMTATEEEGNVILRWEPNRAPLFFSYHVSLIRDGEPDIPLSPMPLRAAEWIDAAPPVGARRYSVRAVSASGVMSATVASDLVVVASG
jgi:glycosyl hydrolase family 39 (putative alpha-L-iduronidase)